VEFVDRCEELDENGAAVVKGVKTADDDEGRLELSLRGNFLFVRRVVDRFTPCFLCSTFMKFGMIMHVFAGYSDASVETLRGSGSPVIMSKTMSEDHRR
jgi:hypothetical protein